MFGAVVGWPGFVAGLGCGRVFRIARIYWFSVSRAVILWRSGSRAAFIWVFNYSASIFKLISNYYLKKYLNFLRTNSLIQKNIQASSTSYVF